MDDKLAIIMFGAPGSGKGTQGEILEKNTGFKRYVMSSLIKEELSLGKNSKFEWVKNFNISNGALLNDLKIFALFRNGFKFEKKVILDGIPRTLDQAYWLYGFLKEHGYKIKVVFLEVDEKKLIDRILLRAKEQNRKDDTKEVFTERLKIFDDVKKVILEVYHEGIIKVKGEGEVENIAKNILEEINSLNF